jgi:hypothetical protein
VNFISKAGFVNLNRDSGVENWFYPGLKHFVPNFVWNYGTKNEIPRLVIDPCSVENFPLRGEKQYC